MEAMTLTEALKTIDPDQLMQHFQGGDYWDADGLLETSDEDDGRYVIDANGISRVDDCGFIAQLVSQFV